MNEIILAHGEIVDDPGTDLMPVAAPLTLFGPDPRQALERMSEIATLLVDVVRSRKLSVRIQGREHLKAEAWTTLGALTGVFAIIEWTRANEAGDGIVARAEARTLAGQLVGAAEAECSRAEKTWRTRDPFAIRSMAQTRATSRALRAPLGQIVVLAGYAPTPEEEMPRPVSVSTPAVGPPGHASDEQTLRVKGLLSTLTGRKPDRDWKAIALEIAGRPWPELTFDQAAELVAALEEHEKHVVARPEVQ